MANKTLLEDPAYNMELYRELLKQYAEWVSYDFKVSFSKKEKDVLLVLLERAKPDVKRKELRRKITSDLERIVDMVLRSLSKIENLKELEEE